MDDNLMPLLIVVGTVLLMFYEWLKTIDLLGEARKENSNLLQQLQRADGRIEILRGERDEALQNYEKLSHSLPWSAPAPQSRFSGAWPPETICSVVENEESKQCKSPS